MIKSMIVTAIAAVAAAAGGAELTVEICRQNGHMTSEKAPLAVKDGKAVFRLAKKGLPADVKWVRIRPDFARVKAGVDGYWVNSEGELGTFKNREKDGSRRSARPHMPFFGMKSPAGAWVAIVTGMPYNYSLSAELKDGMYSLAIVWDREMQGAYEDLAVSFTWLEGADADYSGMARTYRNYQLNRGAVVPLAERVKKQPLLDYMAQWPEVRVRNAWKPVPSPRQAVPNRCVRSVHSDGTWVCVSS